MRHCWLRRARSRFRSSPLPPIKPKPAGGAGWGYAGPGVGIYVGPRYGYYGGYGYGYRPYAYYGGYAPYAYYPFWRGGRAYRRGWGY